MATSIYARAVDKMAATLYEKAVDRATDDIDDPAVLARVKFFIKEFDLGKSVSWQKNTALRKVERTIDFMIEQHKETGILHKELLTQEEVLAVRYYSPNGDMSPKVVKGLLDLELGSWMSHKALKDAIPPKDIDARIEVLINRKGLATEESVETIAKKLEKNKKVSEELGRIEEALDEHCKETVEKQLKPLFASIAGQEKLIAGLENDFKALKEQLEKLQQGIQANQQSGAGRYPTAPPFRNDYSQPARRDGEAAELNGKRQMPAGEFPAEETGKEAQQKKQRVSKKD
ncbi:hypothetical protein QBC38DRAFT_444734 [Podospora fimiseda]|uniref:Uncharacterized protein n=1 Tax=Podospora fimiseda TaxID=252190 RepID=A0AAN7BNL0_9PEZI|nr:hypothetical protein QBC38DRAFT_444734 [Podospora fimiseda]